MSEWPKGREPASAIAELANAIQTAIGWMPQMTDDELEKVERDLGIADRALASIKWARGEDRSLEAGELVHLFPACEFMGSGEPCPNLSTEILRWLRIDGRKVRAVGMARVCASCAPSVRRSLAAMGYAVR